MLTDLRQRLHAIRSAEMPVEQAYGVIKRMSARFSTEATGARFYCPICGAWYRSFAPLVFADGRMRDVPVAVPWKDTGFSVGST